MEMEKRIGGYSLMVLKYDRPLMPPEMLRWINERRRALEAMAREAGRKKPVTQMEAMRVISKTGAINIPDEVFNKLIGRHRC